MSSKWRSRRQFLCQVGIAAGLAAVPLARRGRRKRSGTMTMRLDWLYQGPNAGFLIAQDKGFYEQAGLIDELAAVVKKFSEATVPAISRREAELSFATWVTSNTAGKALGWMSDKDWDDTVAVLKQYGGITTPLEARQLYTNEFVPTASEFVPPKT